MKITNVKTAATSGHGMHLWVKVETDEGIAGLVASPIGTMASCHACASIPNFLVIEFHWCHREYWTTIIKEKTDIIEGGYIALSDRPGIGLELDEEVARQHQYPGTTWFAE